MRKIKTFKHIKRDQGYAGFIIALAEDGTLWRRTDNIGGLWEAYAALPAPELASLIERIKQLRNARKMDLRTAKEYVEAHPFMDTAELIALATKENA